MISLHAIVARKKKEVQDMLPVSAAPTERSFIGALRKQKQARKPGLIAEIKFRSPSEGKLLERTRLPAVLSAYNRHAQALSILCDHEDFGGGYDILETIRSQSSLPILAKEFILDVKQIQRARAAGADAILLIASILSPSQIQELSACAVSLKMAVLFEMHHEEEIAFIPDISPDFLLLGINHRNLSTLMIDLTLTERFDPLLRSRYPQHLIVAESGIHTADDVMRLSAHADAFLIGTAFLKADDPSAVITSLFPQFSSASRQAPR